MEILEGRTALARHIREAELPHWANASEGRRARADKIDEWVAAGKVSVFYGEKVKAVLTQTAEYIALFDDRYEYPSEMLFAQLALVLG